MKKVENTTQNTSDNAGVGHVLENEHSAKLRLKADDEKREKLTNEDSKTLEELEEKIEHYTIGFVDAGESLRRIQAEKLHRATHPTFAEYCRERWGFTPQRADQLIKGATVASAIATAVEITGLPAVENEAQARELGRIETHDDMMSAWELAVERSQGKRVTAALIGKIIGELGLAKAPEPDGSALPERVIRQVSSFATSVGAKLEANPPNKWTPDQRKSLKEGLREIWTLLANVEKELDTLPKESAAGSSDEKP